MTTRFGRARRGAILTAAALMLASAWTAAAAAAPGGDHVDNGRHLGQSTAPATAGGTAASRNASAGAGHASKSKAHHPNGHANAHAQANAAAHASRATGSGAGSSGTRPQAAPITFGAGDPPGNNGTVKIASLGDIDRIPNNTPHPGCTFEVQWYGFDAGSDVVSNVSFTPWAPTGGVGMTVSGPTQVPVGQDAASGAGTPTGLDAVATYTLSFSGAPAKQGYHVRLTVSTPRSLGNDTKTKMFWVSPCQPAPSASATPAGTAFAASTSTSSDSASPAAAAGLAAAADSVAPQAEVGETTTSSAALAAAGTPAAARVPTVIDAGTHQSALHRLIGSPWGLPMLVAGLLIALAGVGMTLRARRQA